MLSFVGDRGWRYSQLRSKTKKKTKKKNWVSGLLTTEYFLSKCVRPSVLACSAVLVSSPPPVLSSSIIGTFMYRLLLFTLPTVSILVTNISIRLSSLSICSPSRLCLLAEFGWIGLLIWIGTILCKAHTQSVRMNGWVSGQAHADCDGERVGVLE